MGHKSVKKRHPLAHFVTKVSKLPTESVTAVALFTSFCHIPVSDSRKKGVRMPYPDRRLYVKSVGFSRFMSFTVKPCFGVF